MAQSIKDTEMFDGKNLQRGRELIRGMPESTRLTIQLAADTDRATCLRLFGNGSIDLRLPD
ncbi:hypothetical protein Tdes44962_MAKER09402 [Teratosphaeria destructans]|uniref:Uncharacterized protein n=1 Tax=Teratosphaeria destructans TaxID=418781 RepID=A0A9W7STI5_9PEZI|nr:hypothetical protein Tdes44962_MAKER09402 [Teratosphaeria destructans]